MKHIEGLQNILIKEQILSAADKLQEFVKEAQQKHNDFEEIISVKKRHPLLVVYQTVAKYFNVEYINLSAKIIDPTLLNFLPETIVQTHQIVIFDRDDQKKLLLVATRDPDDIQTLDFIQKRTGYDLSVYYTDSISIEHVVKQYHKSLTDEIRSLSAAPIISESYKGLTDLHRVARELPIVKIVNVLLDHAIYESASDIHIEPTEKNVIVRYRIDGILYDMMNFPKTIHQALVARIKVLANLKIDEHRLPQDGRIKISTEGKNIAYRVSIFPVYDGEKVVLRLLDESAKILTFEQLGMQKDRAKIVHNNIQKPHGIVYVTGPTGSGKTTTLYSILNLLNTSKVNISTIEDPIEYRIERINQAQVAPKIGFTFAVGLRALLRQDPNVIMVGEIRDEETANIATHAAMTGHLVLTTLHTNDAVSAIFRLSKMGVPLYLIASTTNLIIAQRLVRKICENCRLTVALTKELINNIEEQFKFQDIIDTLVKYGALDSKANLEDIHFYKGKGCDQCRDRGYKGRIGIYEIMEMTSSLSQLILQGQSTEQILNHALKEEMMTMAQDGFLKAKQGITSIEEVLRVTKE